MKENMWLELSLCLTQEQKLWSQQRQEGEPARELSQSTAGEVQGERLEIRSVDEIRGIESREGIDTSSSYQLWHLDGWFVSDGNKIVGPLSTAVVLKPPERLSNFRIVSRAGFNRWYHCEDLQACYLSLTKAHHSLDSNSCDSASAQSDHINNTDKDADKKAEYTSKHRPVSGAGDHEQPSFSENHQALRSGERAVSSGACDGGGIAPHEMAPDNIVPAQDPYERKTASQERVGGSGQSDDLGNEALKKRVLKDQKKSGHTRKKEDSSNPVFEESRTQNRHSREKIRATAELMTAATHWPGAAAREPMVIDLAPASESSDKNGPDDDENGYNVGKNEVGKNERSDHQPPRATTKNTQSSSGDDSAGPENHTKGTPLPSRSLSTTLSATLSATSPEPSLSASAIPSSPGASQGTLFFRSSGASSPGFSGRQLGGAGEDFHERYLYFKGSLRLGRLRSPLSVLGPTLTTAGLGCCVFAEKISEEVKWHGCGAGVSSAQGWQSHRIKIVRLAHKWCWPPLNMLLCAVPLLCLIRYLPLAREVKRIEEENGYSRTMMWVVVLCSLAPPLALAYLQQSLNRHWQLHLKYVS